MRRGGAVAIVTCVDQQRYGISYAVSISVVWVFCSLSARPNALRTACQATATIARSAIACQQQQQQQSRVCAIASQCQLWTFASTIALQPTICLITRLLQHAAAVLTSRATVVAAAANSVSTYTTAAQPAQSASTIEFTSHASSATTEGGQGREDRS